MEAFLISALSFPTIIYTFFLCLCSLLWILTIVGALSLDAGVDIGDVGDLGDLGDIGGDASLSTPHVEVDLGDPSTPAQAVGILTRLGLNGVPITIVISLLSLFGWAISFAVQSYFLASVTIPLIYYGLGLALMVSSFVVAIMITAQLCKPMRKAFRPTLAMQKRHLIGQTVVVHSLKVSSTFGEAIYDDAKGTDLLVKIRANDGNAFKRGDKVTLLKFHADSDYYDIMSEADFLKNSAST